MVENDECNEKSHEEGWREECAWMGCEDEKGLLIKVDEDLCLHLCLSLFLCLWQRLTVDDAIEQDENGLIRNDGVEENVEYLDR